MLFRKIKMFKSGSQKIKPQDQTVKLTPIKTTFYQNCLTCIGAMRPVILKRFDPRFLFRILMRKRERQILGPIHPKAIVWAIQSCPQWSRYKLEHAPVFLTAVNL